ncbi:MAG: hypothetical protein JXK94_03140 [Deltaproteobacteria bacterium]|nr:hypothetical protein [Deltaproteobacteria bacterium]
MKFNMKHQGNILYLLGYLFYISNQPDTAKPYIWLICLALISFAISLVIPLLKTWIKNRRIYRRLTTVTESTGWVLTLLFALSFIPKVQYIETHLALFGLLVLTFLATRNIFPGLPKESNQALSKAVKQTPAVGLPVNKY